MSYSIDALGQIASEVTPRLETSLNNPVISNENLPNHLILRSSVCDFAGGILAAHLQNEYGIRAESWAATHSFNTPESRSHWPIPHRRYRTENGLILEPTWTQFMGLVDLTAERVVTEPELEHYYPEPKVAIFPEDEPHEFIGMIASAAYQFDQDQARQSRAPLAGRSKEAMELIYGRILGRELYRPAVPIDTESQKLINQAALNLASI